MRAACLFVLLCAFTAHAQWVSPIEQSYGPYVPAEIGRQPALVATADRILLAWSEVDALTGIPLIHTGLLDHDGRLVSPITKLAPFTAGAAATFPNVASDGNGFYVAWQEPLATAGVALDPAGAPIGAPRLLTSPTGTKPLIGWSGSAYFAGDSLTFSSDGSPRNASVSVPAGFRYAANGTLVGVLWTSTNAEFRCSFGPFSPTCKWWPASFETSWSLVRDGQQHGSRFTAPYFAGKPLVAGNDVEMALVWYAAIAEDLIRGIRVVNGEYQSGFSVRLDRSRLLCVPASIAFDGERWLLVMVNGEDIYGAFIEHTGFEFVPFAIETGPRRASAPQVFALSRGRFLVTYDSDSPNDHRIAGRIVLREPPSKRRSVR